MENGQTCSLIGQCFREGFDESQSVPLRIKQIIKQEILRLFFEENVTHFITGMALGVEQICAEMVLELKETCPQFTLECAIPYEEQAVRWTEKQRERYFSIVASCDTETLLQTKYSRNCMRRKTEYLMDHSSFVLAVWDGMGRDGTSRAVRYARKLGRDITIVHPKTLVITREKELNMAAE